MSDVLLIEKWIPFDRTGFLFVGLSSSESLLLDEAAFFTGFWTTGLVVVGVDLTGDFFCVLSSEESESDDESFFLLVVRLAGGGIAAFCVTRMMNK
jgi:hypothetical protein